MRGTPSLQVPSHVLNHNNERISPTKHPLPSCYQNQQTNEVRPTEEEKKKKGREKKKEEKKRKKEKKPASKTTTVLSKSVIAWLFFHPSSSPHPVKEQEIRKEKEKKTKSLSPRVLDHLIFLDQHIFLFQQQDLKIHPQDAVASEEYVMGDKRLALD